MPKDTNKSLVPIIVIKKNQDYVECCICLDEKMTINQPCGLNAHRICFECISTIIHTIPISVESPDIYCQYPYDTGCNHTYGKSFIKSILKERYPIYRVARDMYTYDEYSSIYCPGCKKLLTFDGDLDDDIYECVYCFRAYCIICKTESEHTEGKCSKCCSFYNINPLAHNYFFYKTTGRKNISDYLLFNFEIKPEEACSQIVENVKNACVSCPACLSPLSRSEQCNSLRHCHIEICFSCGKFSNIGLSLTDHWSARGHGCPRWDSDPVIKSCTPDYVCKEGACYSHDIGDCVDITHVLGKNSYTEFKKSQYVYHSLKSLLPRIRYKVIDILPSYIKDYLPRDVTWDRLDCDSQFDDIRDHILPITEI